MQRTPGVANPISSQQDLAALGSLLTDPMRKYPAIVIVDDAGVDADEVARSLPLCDVFLVSRRSAADVVPRRWSALSMTGTAARVFPGVDFDWRARPDLSRYFRGKPTGEEIIAAAKSVVPGLGQRQQAIQSQKAKRAVGSEADHQVVTIRSLDGVGAMVERLLDHDRDKPVAVITVMPGDTAPVIDAEAVRAAAPGEVEVYVLPEREMTFELSARIGRSSGVFGGAGRVYAVGTNWINDPSTSRLHLVDTPHRARFATDRMISDVIREAESARVAQFHRQQSTVRPAVAESFDPLGSYRRGDLVLARVATVDATSAEIELFPDTRVPLPLDEVTGNDLDRLDDLMSADEVIVVRVVSLAGDEPGWTVTMLDIDDDAPIQPAPAVRPGGEQWIRLADNDGDLDGLLPPETLAERPEPAVPAAAGRPLPGPAELRRRDERIASLEHEVKTWKDEAGAQRDNAQRYYEKALVLGQQLQDVKTRARKVRVRTADETDGESLFADAEQQFRWEVFQTWAKLIPAAEKTTTSLPSYSIGPDLLPSLSAMTRAARRKLLRTVVQVLLNRASGVHPLRQGEAGGAPPVTHGAATCMRVGIEDGTPSARRLHFWRGPNGRIELSKVGIHDDFTPGAAPTFADTSPAHWF